MVHSDTRWHWLSATGVLCNDTSCQRSWQWQKCRHSDIVNVSVIWQSDTVSGISKYLHLMLSAQGVSKRNMAYSDIVNPYSRWHWHRQIENIQLHCQHWQRQTSWHMSDVTYLSVLVSLLLHLRWCDYRLVFHWHWVCTQTLMKLHLQRKLSVVYWANTGERWAKHLIHTVITYKCWRIEYSWSFVNISVLA